MWRELKVDDKDLEEISNLRNTYDCSQGFSRGIISHCIKDKRDCHYFYYKDNDYEILIGFSKRGTDDSIQYVAYSIGKFGDLEYYKKAFRIIAKKTREYLDEKNNTLIQNIKCMGIANKTAAFMGGIEAFLETAKPIYLSCGVEMNIDYENNFFEMI